MKSTIGKFVAAAATVAALSLPEVALGADGDQGSLTMSNYAYGGMSFSIASAAHTGNVGVGGFSASYDANGPAAPKSFVAYCLDLAQSFNWSSSFNVTETNPSVNQDQMMATPVPEPQTYMMLLAGVGLMGFVARRRQRELAA